MESPGTSLSIGKFSFSSVVLPTHNVWFPYVIPLLSADVIREMELEIYEFLICGQKKHQQEKQRMFPLPSKL